MIDSGRPCPTSGDKAKVDLVIVIDTSGSMEAEAENLSKAAEDAIKAAKASCPSDLRVVWLGIEGVWDNPPTNFTQTVRDYLHGLVPPIPDSDIKGRKEGDIGHDAREDGGRAIEDISDHFDWRAGATRMIFYLGDEGMEGGNPDDERDREAADRAIAAARAASVIVHTYLGTPGSALHYDRVANETGGEFFSHQAGNLPDFKEVLEKVICAGTKVCKPVEIPELAPCFRLRWGDGPNDQIETSDMECLCLTACNRYSNVTFKDLVVFVTEVTRADGTSVLNLPDGTPSVFVKPSRLICFGDLPPCNAKVPDQLSCLSRELVLISSGAVEETYLLKIKYCYSVEFAFQGTDQFKLPLYAS